MNAKRTRSQPESSSAADGAERAARGAWWEQVRHAADALVVEMAEVHASERIVRFELLMDRLRRARLLADHRPGWPERARQWWTQSDAIEALSAIHVADEALSALRPRSDLAARLPILHADLTRLLGEEDPRRRDALRLLDRLMDQVNEPWSAATLSIAEPSAEAFEDQARHLEEFARRFRMQAEQMREAAERPGWGDETEE